MESQTLENTQQEFGEVIEIINATKDKVNAVKILEKELKEFNELEKKLNAKKERITKLTKQFNL